MPIECDEDTAPTLGLLGLFDHLADDRSVTDVKTIEGADRDDARQTWPRASGEVLDDQHGITR
jgi:hypothetical protein